MHHLAIDNAYDTSIESQPFVCESSLVSNNAINPISSLNVKLVQHIKVVGFEENLNARFRWNTEGP